MSNRLLQIDISYQKHKKNEDLIEIKFKNDDFLQVNFSNFFIQSKYIQDKYKYSEALNSIQAELEKVEEKYNISVKSIKLFIQLIQKEKESIPFECYRDFCTLSEYFCIQNCIDELETASREELLKDLNFTIQILFDSEAAKSVLEKKLTSKIEKFLSERINDCFDNEKFCKLPLSTIFRILERSEPKSINHNLLLDFILGSIESRFILLKFIKFEKLTDEKVDEFINFFDELDEDSRKIYFEYISFDLSFIKYLKNNYNNLFKEMNQIKHEFNQTKQDLNCTKNELNNAEHELNNSKDELNQTKKDLNSTKDELNKAKQELNNSKDELNKTKQELNNSKDELNKTKQELNNSKDELNKTKQELNNSKDELNKTKQELNNSKDELNNTKDILNQTRDEVKKDERKHDKVIQELDQCKRELKQNKDEINRITSEIKQYSQAIIVAGKNTKNQLGEKFNNTNKYNEQIISPPVNLTFNHSSLLSYSVYQYHSILVTSDGFLKGVGKNEDGLISASLQKAVIDHFTEFSIKDSNGRQLHPISAVCYNGGNIFMFAKMSGNQRQLVLCDKDIKGGDPIFLDIGNHHPVALFGGCYYLATICSEGEVIFINRDYIKNSPESRIEAIFLPDNEKASYVACCKDSILVLSSKGKVYSSSIDTGSSILKFKDVIELKDKEIVCISGTYNHFLAVSKEGHVFGRGSNEYGKLGFGKEKETSSSFTEISSFEGYKIRAAYAGGFHSLFETQEGKILSCGFNGSGELLLSSGPSDNVYLPTETTIKNGATFCIAGDGLSIVFIGHCPPPNTPNMLIQHYL